VSTTLTPLRFEGLWTALGVGFVLLVVYLSLASDPPDIDIPGGFDFGHLIAYGWLTIWFAQIHLLTRRRFAFAAGFCALGVALELAQTMTATRMFELTDIALDFAGVLIGLILAYTPVQHALRMLERLLAPR